MDMKKLTELIANAENVEQLIIQIALLQGTPQFIQECYAIDSTLDLPAFLADYKIQLENLDK